MVLCIIVYVVLTSPVLSQTRICELATRGEGDALQDLLDGGADPNTRCGNGYLLDMAVREGHAAVVRLLLRAEADARWPTLLVYGAAGRNHSEVVQVLARAGYDLTTRVASGKAPIHIAAVKGSWAALWVLVERGVDINFRDVRGWTPLHYAASTGNVDVIRALLLTGAEAGIVDDDGKTAVNIAADKGHVEAVRLLLGRQ